MGCWELKLSLFFKFTFNFRFCDGFLFLKSDWGLLLFLGLGELTTLLDLLTFCFLKLRLLGENVGVIWPLLSADFVLIIIGNDVLSLESNLQQSAEMEIQDAQEGVVVHLVGKAYARYNFNIY